jgi:CubicO group peptidase (beta-lactamase class C family)
MRHRAFLRLAGSLGILLSPNLVWGQPQPTFPYADVASLGIAREQLTWLGNEINTWVGSGELVGAELLVLRSGQVVHHEAYGWSDREARRPLERNSIFTIQSMSKPFTAAAILTLVEEGLLSLGDPLRRYVPGFPNDSTTIHHLLTHTSG